MEIRSVSSNYAATGNAAAARPSMSQEDMVVKSSSSSLVNEEPYKTEKNGRCR